MELVAGIVVAVAALALVLEPLVRGGVDQGVAASPDEGIDFADIQESESPKIQALLALKEIEFDRATGKLSDEDYGALKKRYADAALAAIKAEEAAGAEVGDAVDDPAEAAIRKARANSGMSCPTCGPRPATDSTFCSNCGKQLVAPGGTDSCASCGERIPPGGKFCASCGTSVGALVER
ncbi:MAG: zinc ribbon domain-containing protein [Gemmatimonadota bacterium]|nr:MAG: zinc ribbon domain-containing protein [Gemmatimonadota bacterium]